MNDDELWDALSGIRAYDAGYTDSGLQDDQ